MCMEWQQRRISRGSLHRQVRVSIRAGDITIVREGSGTGEGKAPLQGKLMSLPSKVPRPMPRNGRSPPSATLSVLPFIVQDDKASTQDQLAEEHLRFVAASLASSADVLHAHSVPQSGLSEGQRSPFPWPPIITTSTPPARNGSGGRNAISIRSKSRVLCGDGAGSAMR